MSVGNKIVQAAAGNAGGVDVDEVFATTLYTGNGASSRDITNNLDLAADSGVVWTKARTTALGHVWYSPEIYSGSNYSLQTESTSGHVNEPNAVISYNSDGYEIGSFNKVNSSGHSFVSWAFKKHPQFMDIVTWTGNGSGARDISFDLDVDVGMIIAKQTNAADDWYVWHNVLGAGPIYGEYSMNLNNRTTKQDDEFYLSAPTDTTFEVSTYFNGSGDTFIAYVFGHDTSDGGVIQCGSYASTGQVTLGWEPQWVMVKPVYRSDQYTGSWRIVDNKRSSLALGDDAYLMADNTDAEQSSAFGAILRVNSTGFIVESQGYDGPETLYVAIRDSGA